MASSGLHVTPLHADGHDPARWFVVLHGIYGRGRNWASVARDVVSHRPAWGALLVDLRLHGDSRGFAPPHTVGRAANDVRGLLEGRAGDGPVPVVLGHSFGGKVALALAPMLANTLDQVWLIESTPAARPASGSAWNMLEIVRALPTRFASRAEAVDAIEAAGMTRDVAAWMATNLRNTQNGFEWQLDFDAMEALLRDFFALDLWPLVENPPGHLHVHVVKAEESSTLDEDACARVLEAGRRNGRVHLHRVAGGHWVNADNPGALVQLLTRELS
jgi:esterase